MEITNGFNDQPEKDPKRSFDDATESDSKTSKKGRRQGEKNQSRPEDDEKRRSKVEPLGQMIIGEEIVLFEKPKQEDKLQNDKKAESIDDQPAEEALSEAVEAEVSSEFIQQRIPEVEAEIIAAQSAEETVVAQANEQFLEAARDRIQAEPGKPVEQVLAEAYRETAADISGRPVAETEVPPIETPEAPPVFTSAETAAEQPEDIINAETPIEKPSIPLSPLEAARQAAAQAHEAEAPRDSAFWLDQPSRSIEGAVSPSAAHSEALPTAASNTSEIVVTKSSWAALLTGYVVGRRGGRKRSEKRTKPVIERLHKTVKSLQETVSGREAQIRDLSREQVRVHKTAEQRSREVPTMPLPVMNQEAALAPAQMRPEATPPRPEATSVQPRAEQAPAQRTAETTPPIIAEQLATPQLLQVAEQIRVDGISVRSMHEVGRFDENSLRRIVHEYLGGNRNIAQVVAQETEKHDRNRFARFETLNQASTSAVAATIATDQAIAPQHGSLPRPINPAMQQSSAVNPSGSTSGPVAQPVGTAEKVVLGTSVLFIVLAIVIIGVVLSRS